MGRELQKKKNRSSIPKVRQRPKSRKLSHPRGNAIVAANWDKSQTLRQNYSRLGLAVRLNASTGGTEKLTKALAGESKFDPLNIVSGTQQNLQPGEAKVERDENGSIIRVIHSGQSPEANPLKDPLNEFESESELEREESTGFPGSRESQNIPKTTTVTLLEKQASNVAPTKKRKLSAREEEWVIGLVSKYGDDYAAMMRDRKLNPMQQSAGDLRRRIKRWKESTGGNV